MNPVLDAIRNVPKEFGDIACDFKVGRTTGVLYLSLKYHRLHPEYIHSRIERLAGQFDLRILLILCDVSEHQDPIRELTKTCLINEMTIIVAWSTEEAAHYLTTYKQFEFKPPNMIKERVVQDYSSILQAGLTSIRGINKTDVETLRTNLGSVADISKASEQALSNLPGFGPIKVRRLQEAFQKPFYPSKYPKKTPFQFRVATGTVTEADEMAMALVQEEELLSSAQFPVASSSRVRLDDLRMDNSGGNSTMSGSGPSSIQKTTPTEFRSSTTADRPRPPRSPSPVWDIELDLNDDDESPPPEIEVEKGGPTESNDIISGLQSRPLKKLKTVHTFEEDPVDVIVIED